MLSVCLPASAFLASFIIDADNLGILRFANFFFPLSALNEGRKCRFADADNGTGFLLRRFRGSREDAGAAIRFPCTTPLTRLFDRSGAVELRALAVIAVIGQRAECDWGRFLCQVRELFAGDACFDAPCLFPVRCFSFASEAEAGLT